MTPPPRRRWASGGLLTGFLAVLALILGVLLVAELFRDEDAATPSAVALDDEGLLEPDDVLSVREVHDRAAQLEGQQVTIGGTLMMGLVSEHISVFGGDLYGTEDLPVVTERLAPGVFPAGALARATGTLVAFNEAEVEGQLGIEIEDGLLEEEEDQMALLADSIHFFLGGTNLGSQLEGLATPANEPGWQVTLAGEVEEVYSPSVFRLTENVVIVGATGEGEPSEGAAAQVTGAAAILDESTTTPDALAELSDEQREEIEGYPMVIADEVQFAPAQ